MRKSRAGSLNGVIGYGALRITLSISISNYSTEFIKQGREVPVFTHVASTKLFGGIINFLEYRGLVNLNCTGSIPSGNTGFFLHIEDFAATHPIESFLD